MFRHTAGTRNRVYEARSPAKKTSLVPCVLPQVLPAPISTRRSFRGRISSFTKHPYWYCQGDQIIYFHERKTVYLERNNRLQHSCVDVRHVAKGIGYGMYPWRAMENGIVNRCERLMSS